MLNIKKLILYGLSVFTTGVISLNMSQAASVPNSSFIDDSRSYQTAFVYFLPDYKDGEMEGNDHNREYCRKQGYDQSHATCPSPRILKQRCPVGNYYKECYCAGSTSCTGSKSSSNPYPTSTGASSTSCVDCSGNTLWTWTCSSSTCASYQLTSCPSRGYCSRCCDGYYKLDSCQSGYHIEGSGSSARCVETCVPYSNETGCSYGTESCSDGCGGTRTCCKACTETCSSKGYLSSRPSNKTCSTTTVCGSTCYYNCQDNHTHSYSCPSGFSTVNSWGSSARTTSKTCSCGGTSGTCYAAPACTPLNNESGCEYGTINCDDGCGGTRQCCKICDLEDRYCDCPGKVYCDPATKVGDGATCTDRNGKVYHERCLVKETCDTNQISENGGTCYGTTNSNIEASSSAYYLIGERCTLQNGTKVYNYYSCGGFKDCTGQTMCAGKKKCPGDQGTGECSCGGGKYFDSCTDTCDNSGLSENGGYCPTSKTTDCTGNETCGYYTVKTKCTTLDGVTYVYSKSCTDSGKDCNGATPPCSGYKKCEDGATGSGKTCTCGGKTFYESCSDCDTSGKMEDGDYYGANYESSIGSGSQKLDFKCTMSDGSKVYYYVGCTDDKKKAPCKGYRSSCPSGSKLGGSTCSCGDKTYYSDCVAECNYEETEASCAAQGKSFESKCHGDNADESEWIWYGICK